MLQHPGGSRTATHQVFASSVYRESVQSARKTQSQISKFPPKHDEIDIRATIEDSSDAN